MRIAKSIFVGSMAALAALTAPALAKNSNVQKTDDSSGVLVLSRLSAGRRWILDAVALPGDGLPVRRTTAAQVCEAKRPRGKSYALKHGRPPPILK